MFLVKTYVNIPSEKITDLRLVQGNLDKYFIEVGDSDKLNNISNLLDFNYLNGAIYLEYSGSVLMDYRMWDLVDQLWAYFLNLIEEVLEKKKGSFYFPDQPLKVEMKEVSYEWILFRVGQDSSITLPKNDFLHSLVHGAERFFLSMRGTFETQCSYSHELMVIDKLKKLI